MSQISHIIFLKVHTIQMEHGKRSEGVVNVRYPPNQSPKVWAAQKIAQHLDSMYKHVVVVAVFIILMSLPIAVAVVGATRRSECPIKTWIPTWLTVFGSVGIGMWLILIITVC